MLVELTFQWAEAGSKQINNQDNFTLDKYSKDSKQGNVGNGRSADLSRMSEVTET